MNTNNPKVFISYSRESDTHAERVLAFANRLRTDGIDVVLDRYKEFGPTEGWNLWMACVLREGGIVLIICCPSYYARIMGDAKPGTGQGVRWEGNLILQYLKESDTYNDRFLPVLFDDGNAKYIPDPFRSFQYYTLKGEDGYNQLYRRLTDQPAISIPPLGPIKALAPNETKTDFFSSASHPATPPKPRNIPSSIKNYFKGREPFLEQIRKTLAEAGHKGQHRAAAITATVATVHGLGGIGKTRVAIEYAHRYAGEYTALLFVQADSPDSLKANLAKLCGPFVLDLPEKVAKELDVQVAAALRWLQQHPGWFLIFDNVDTKEAAKAVEDLLSKLSQAGQVLITSRIGHWSKAVQSLALDVLAEQDAADFLLLRTDERRRKSPDDPAQARTLAFALGQLALAIEQAGAYIAENRLTFGQYHAKWQTQHDKVIRWFDESLMQYPRSVAVTWQTSFDQLTEPARQLLQRLAWFAPDPIPESLLDVNPGIADAPDWLEALANLETYSLVTRSKEAPTFTIHRLWLDMHM